MTFPKTSQCDFSRILLVLFGGIFLQLPTTAPAGITRDTSGDHMLPSFRQPHVDLARYKSVQLRNGQDPDLALAVAVSGGGHRAANFAAGVFLALEEYAWGGDKLDLLKEVDYFSTVSGGGFPVAAYVSARWDHTQAASGVGDAKEPFTFRQALHEHDRRLLYNLRRDYQTTILQAGVSPDCFGYFDAGDLLESKFDRANAASLRECLNGARPE